MNQQKAILSNKQEKQKEYKTALNGTGRIRKYNVCLS